MDFTEPTQLFDKIRNTYPNAHIEFVLTINPYTEDYPPYVFYETFFNGVPTRTRFPSFINTMSHVNQNHIFDVICAIINNNIIGVLK